MATLRILSGAQKGEKFEIDRDLVVIGRSSKNIVCIDDPSVSGEHCCILREGRKFTLRDMNSTNGTKLNDVPITEYRLSPKDTISVGNVELEIEGKDIEDAPTSTFTKAEDTQVTVRMDSVAPHTPTGSGQAVFAAKKEGKKLWLIIFSVIGVLIVAGIAFFILRIFQN